MSDEQIISAIQTGDKDKESEALKFLIDSALPVISFYIKGKGGTDEDIEEISQEGIIALWQSIQKEDFQATARLATFLFSICKNLWLKKHRQAVSEKSLLKSFPREEPVSMEELILREKKYEIMRQVLEGLGLECRQIIISYYYKRKPLAEIADDLTISPGYIRNKKYRCLKELRKQVLSRWRDL